MHADSSFHSRTCERFCSRKISNSASTFPPTKIDLTSRLAYFASELSISSDLLIVS
jgi:hypothetical protein